MLRLAVNLTLFVLAFAAVGWVISEARPFARFPVMQKRVAMLEALDPPCDTLFIGSSRIHRGVIPEVFDRRLDRVGLASSSFNAAVGGMRPHECNVNLRKIIESGIQPIRRVFIELSPWNPRVAEANRFVRRTFAWHTAEELPAILDSEVRLSRLEAEIAADLAAAEEADGPAVVPGPSLATRLYGHLEHFAGYWTNVGEGPFVWRQLLGQDFALGPASEQQRLDRGWQELTTDSPEAIEFRKRFLDGLDGYGHQLVRKTEGSLDPRKGDLLAEDALLAQARWLVARGIEVVYVIPPVPKAIAIPAWLEDGREGVRLLRFDFPADYPTLFVLENRVDFDHLTANGARLFTTALADKYAATR